MKALIGLIQPAFDWTWKNSLQVALLVGLVLLVQTVLARWLTPRLRYALSLLILLRLLLPAVPPSPLSLENLFRPAARLEAHSLAPERGRLGEASLPEASRPDVPVTPMVAEPVPVAPATPIPVNTPFVSAPPSRLPTLSVAEALGLAWACGLLVLVSLAGWRYAQWCRLIRQGRRLSDPRLLALLDGARQAMGVRRPVTLVAMASLGSPAVFGFRRVRLLLPEIALDQLTDQDLRLLFLHEMAHVRRHDILLNLLLMAVQFVHWFNPLLWLGLHRLRADRELVCDAMVLQRARPEERSSYGLLLLKLLTDFPTDQTMIPTAVPVVRSQRELKRRIVLIKHQRSASRGVYVATVMAAVALACVTFTGSSQQPSVVPVSATSSATTNSSSHNGPSNPGLPAEQQPLVTRFYSKVSTNELIQGLYLDLTPTATNGPASIARALLDYFKQAGVDLDQFPSSGKAIFYDDRRGTLMVRATLHDLDIVEHQLYAALRIAAGTEHAPRALPKSLSSPVMTNSSASNALLKPPTLHFLAWRHEWQTNQPGAAWHPDGSPVTDRAELNWLRQVKPADPDDWIMQLDRQMKRGTNIISLKPRILYLWFSCPSRTPIGFDQLSLLDGADRGTPNWGPSLAATGWQEPNDRNGGLGWSTACLLTGDALNVPPRVTVRLDYTGGPLERVKELAITPSLATPIPVVDGAAVKGYGQDAKERAFVSIAVDGEKIWSRRFDVIAVTTDGREITSIPRVCGDTAKPASGVVKFEFDLPLARVAKFRIGSRAIRTRQWTDVVMTESKQNLYGDMRQTLPGKSQSSSLSQPESTPGVPLLIQGRPVADWVKEAEISVRPGKEGEHALRVLENAGPPIMPQLSGLLREDDFPEIQAKAAWTMSVIGYHNPDAPEVHSAVPVLTTAAQNQNSEVRIYSVQALGAIGRAASNAAPVLIRLTKDENDGVRMSAVEALGRIGATSPESIEALTAAASDASSDVRITARKALEILVLPRPRQPLPEATAVNAFHAIGPSVVPALISLLKDDDPFLRSDAAWALGSLQSSNRLDQEAISPLIGALADPNAMVRLQAAATLGEFGPGGECRQCGRLIARLKDDEKGADSGSCGLRARRRRSGLGQDWSRGERSSSHAFQPYDRPKPLHTDGRGGSFMADRAPGKRRTSQADGRLVND